MDMMAESLQVRGSENLASRPNGVKCKPGLSWFECSRILLRYIQATIIVLTCRALKSMLSPRFIKKNRNCIREIKAAAFGQHWDAQYVVFG